MDRIAKIREFLKQQPDDSFLQHALALELIKRGEDAEACTLFRAILDRNPPISAVIIILANYWKGSQIPMARSRSMKKGWKWPKRPEIVMH